MFSGLILFERGAVSTLQLYVLYDVTQSCRNEILDEDVVVMNKILPMIAESKPH